LNFADCKTRFSGGENVDLVKGVDLIEKEKKRRKKDTFFQLQVVQLFPLPLEKVRRSLKGEVAF